jgi:hypothetical protein
MKLISEYFSVASKILFSWHVLIVTALLCLGYVAHLVWGANNPVEQVDEEILKDVFGVDVEFSK